MTRTKKLIIFAITATAAVCTYYLLISNPSSNSLDPIHQVSKSSEENKISKDTKTEVHLPKREQTSAKNEEINNKFTIDLQLSKDLVEALSNNNKQERLLELIRLADIHSENLLLQYLAATNCLEQSKIFCNVENFSQRILNQKPASATAKSFLAAMHLHNNDEASMLDELKKIDTNDRYDSFFYELTQSLEPAFEEKVKEKYSLAVDELKPMLEKDLNNDLNNEQFNKILNNAIRKGIIEKATEHMPNTHAQLTCMNKLSPLLEPIQPHWVEPCANLASSMTKADTHFSQAIGYRLQTIIYELQNDKINLDRVQSQENDRDLLYIAATEVLNSDEFILSDQFDLYYEESISFGEMQAMENLMLRRQKSN